MITDELGIGGARDPFVRLVRIPADLKHGHGPPFLQPILYDSGNVSHRQRNRSCHDCACGRMAGQRTVISCAMMLPIQRRLMRLTRRTWSRSCLLSITSILPSRLRRQKTTKRICRLKGPLARIEPELERFCPKPTSTRRRNSAFVCGSDLTRMRASGLTARWFIKDFIGPVASFMGLKMVDQVAGCDRLKEGLEHVHDAGNGAAAGPGLANGRAAFWHLGIQRSILRYSEPRSARTEVAIYGTCGLFVT